MHSNTFRVSLVAVAVLALAILGWRFLPASNTGTSASPTPQPTPPPALGSGQDLAAGTYRGVLPGSADRGFTITVPAGWDAVANVGVAAADRNPPDTVGALLFWDVENLYADPLAPAAGGLEPPVGPSAADLVEALVAHDGWTTSAPTDVTVGGYPGTYLELTVPSDAAFDGCDGDGFSVLPFATWYEPDESSWRCMNGPGQIDRVYVLDVDGERVVFTVVVYPEQNSPYLDALMEMVDSLEFPAG